MVKERLVVGPCCFAWGVDVGCIYLDSNPWASNLLLNCYASSVLFSFRGCLNMTYLVDEFHIFPPASHRCPDPVHIRFVVDQMALGQASFQVLLFSPASIIPPGMHILHLLLLSEGQAGETWKLLNKQCCRKFGSIRMKKWFSFNILKTQCICVIYVRTASTSVIKSNLLMFCKAKFAVCSEIHTQHKNSMWSQWIFECHILWYVKLPVGFNRLNFRGLNHSAFFCYSTALSWCFSHLIHLLWPSNVGGYRNCAACQEWYPAREKQWIWNYGW
jgi:hypothetical protein